VSLEDRRNAARNAFEAARARLAEKRNLAQPLADKGKTMAPAEPPRGPPPPAMHLQMKSVRGAVHEQVRQDQAALANQERAAAIKRKIEERRTSFTMKDLNAEKERGGR
jgi:hypothetical protein